MRRTYQLIFATLIGLVLAQLVLSLRRDGFEKAIAASQQRRHELHLMADELRQSSDELTRMARTFAVTGNPVYERYFNEILGIRDGRRPRPADYDKVYWDLVIALGAQPPATGPAVALDTLLDNAGFTAAERELLQEAKRNSDGLVLLERVAMNAVKGIYRDAGGQFSLRGQPNLAYAAQILHGTEYHRAKARIMDPIRRFEVLLDRRTQAEIRGLQRRSLYNARAETGLIIAAVLLLVVSFLILNRRIIEPILQLTASAAAVGRNGFFRRVIVDHDDELGTLAGALNRMSETVEQKISESEANEERFRSLIEAAPDALVIADDEGRIVLVNRRTETLLGYARAELVGQPVELLVPERLRGEHRTQREQFSRAPRARDMGNGVDLFARRKDGSELPVEISLSPITAADGSRLVCSAIRDVTERKSAEAEISRQLAFQAAMLDTIPYPMFIKDPDARFQGCNKAYEEAFGVSREFLAGRTVLDLGYIPEAAREAFHAEDLEVIRTASRRSYELPITYKDQTEHVTLYTVDGFRLPDGSPGGLIGLLVDITDRKRAEEEVNEQRRLFQAIIDNANAFIYVKDTEGRYLFVNRNYEALLGRPAAELIGRTATDLFGPRLGENYEEGDREVRRTRELREHEEQTEMDGTTRYFISHKFPLVNEEGQLFGTAGVSTEITEIKRVQADLAVARDAADAANAAKSAFLATMSHEIRTPMNAIINMTGLALETDLDPKLRQYLSVTDASARGLLALINDILDFSKIEAGRMELEAAPFRLRKLLEELTDSFRGKVLEKQIEFVVTTALDVPDRLVGDTLRLRQVLINLVGNAFKFTEHGEVVVRVTLLEDTLPDDEGQGGSVLLRFSVRDTGVGIPADKIAQLGESFTQADSSTARKYGGTGLGLAICKRIVGMMGGTLQISSKPGAGSEFSFAARFGYSQDDREEEQRLPSGLGTRRVLVVEDNETSRELLATLFGSYGMKCDLVGTADAGWKKLQSGRYGLAVLDWLLPGEDGLQLARRIREQAATRDLPLILVSCFAGKEEEAQARAIGVDAFVPKPLTTSALFDAVVEALHISHPHPRSRSPAVDLDEREFAGKRVLLAEDNEANQFVAEELLSRAGITLEIANNGREAIEMAEAGNFDAILMDMQMPEIDGLEATRHIRRNLGGRPLPIIALTANAMQRDLEACLQAGMNDYVAKPIDRKLLFRVLRKWLLSSGTGSPTDSLPVAPAGAEALPTKDPAAAGAEVTATGENAGPGPEPSAGEEARKTHAEEGGTGDSAPAVGEKPASDPVGEGMSPADASISAAGPAGVVGAQDGQVERGADSEPVELTVEAPRSAPPAAKPRHKKHGPEEAAPPTEDRTPDEPQPAPRKRAGRKKKSKVNPQAELFASFDDSGDDAGPIRVTLDQDGVPVVPGVDLRDAMNRLGLPLEAIRKMVIRFAGTLPQSFAELRAAMDARDLEASRRHAHSIAGAAGNLSADALRRLAKTLELAIKFEQGDAAKMLAELEHEAARLMEGVRQLEKLPAEQKGVQETGERPQSESATPADIRRLRTVLEELIAGLEEGDYDAIGIVVEKLKMRALPDALQGDYERLSELVDAFDYAEAAELVRRLQERLPET